MCKFIVIVLAGLAVLATVAAAPAAARAPQSNGQILFARFDPLLEDTVIYTVNPDGTGERQLLPFGLQCPRWSPDGTRIATCGSPTNGATTIIDADDGSYHTLPMPDPDDLFTACPVWSPDAARFACESFGETDPSLNGIYTIRSSDGGELTRMTSNPGGDDLPGDYAPNGKRFVFARYAQDGEPDGLYVVKVDNGRVLALTPAGTIVTSAGDWSPQGNTIVFSRRVSADMRQSLWAVHSDGSGLRQISVEGARCGLPIADPTSVSCFAPRWSPDGAKLVFTIFSAVAGENVYTVNADATGLTQVTHGADDESPDWGTHRLTR